MTDISVVTSSGPGGLGADYFARLANQLPIVVWSTDRDLCITSRHGGLLTTFGLSPGAGDGQHVALNIDPHARAPVIVAHRAALAGQSGSYETMFRNRTFAAHVDPLVGPEGSIVGVVGFAFDVSERRRADTALRDSETRLRTIIESEPECVKLVDRQGRLLDMNPAGLAMVEADSIDQVRGQPIQQVVAPEQRAAFHDLVQRVFAGGCGKLEFEIIGMRGTRRWLDTHAVPLRGPDGVITAALCITRDVSERKRSEEQLRASRAALRLLATRHQDVREDERTRIAREIHDSLGQALTALKLQLAAAQEAATRNAPGLAERLCETAHMVDDLVKGVRRFATELRPPILDELGLPAAVEWLAHDFSRRTDIASAATVHPSDAAIPADLATALFRIVQEALTNVARHARASQVSIALEVTREVVTLEVNDDGRGISETVASGPASLGILGMRERAAALGGVLEVGPRPTGGTRVAAWFPPPRPGGPR